MVHVRRFPSQWKTNLDTVTHLKHPTCLPLQYVGGLWKPHVRISQENGKVVCLLLHLAIVLLPSAILADRLERSSSHESRGQGADEEMDKRSWKMCQAAHGEAGNDKI